MACVCVTNSSGNARSSEILSFKHSPPVELLTYFLIGNLGERWRRCATFSRLAILPAGWCRTLPRFYSTWGSSSELPTCHPELDHRRVFLQTALSNPVRR